MAAPNLSPDALRLMADSRGFQSSFSRSWSAIAPSVGISGTWEKSSRGRRVAAGQAVRIELTIKADPKFRAFLRRLDQAPPHIKKEFKRIIRTAVRQEIIPRLKKNIPQSDLRKPHLRATAKVLSVNLNRAIVGVGSSKLFYAAIVHAGRQGGKKGTVPARPFFPQTFKKALHPLNRRLLREVADLLRWIDTGYQRRRR